jgi:glycosyltransferase involved in cell wall biosynthesis
MLIPSYNTKKEFLIECIDSIKEQVGHFGLELVWINDGSTPENTKILEDLLHEKFKNPVEDSGYINHFKLVYHNNIENKNIRYTLNKGVLMCTHELVLRLDSDDVMLKDRIITQIVYMLQNPDCILCGADVYDFSSNSNNKNEIIKLTNFSPSLTWKELSDSGGKINYILSHPTYCFIKNKILEAGNYNKDFEHNFEDLDLLVRILKKYNKINNIDKPLVLYRSHETQITKVGGQQLYSKVIEYINKILSN